ncbi:glycosyltransferase 87 family protein [Kitasatospora sp. NBC_01287]|uniref:glycosyltransferase 87 family protein n=1 Tax=Kitasatospora sp. NBC_01287 TaxID=2903573 RepID=UPI00225106A7|nr:glycosyltransferase 87 family protein [Kitasatospora sp. NBC_01287]MCX4747495.1 glycosyltransferase 87 family protein [Kitasatospora sp. NBC_01287]
MDDRGEHGASARPRLFGTTGVAATAAVISLGVFAIWRHFYGVSMVDMLVYRAEGQAVVSGHDLYTMRLPGWDLPATYPPFAAMLFVPSTWFSVGMLRALVMILNVGLLGLLGWFSFTLAGWPRRRFRLAGALLVAGFGVWLEPVWTTLQYGQVNLGIACLVLYDLTRPDRHRGKGIAIGIAAGLKLTPGLFTVYLLLTGRIRAALVSGATFLATVLIGVVALPGASWGFWTKYVWDTSRVGVTELVDDQSMRGAVARLLSKHDPGLLATLSSGLALVLGLGIAVLAARATREIRRAEAWGVVCTAITALLLSPISWTHHWIWCVPLLVLLGAESAQELARPRGVRRLRWRVVLGLTAAVFLSYAMWLVPQSGGLGVPWYWQVPSSVYPLTGVAVLALMGRRLLRIHRPTIARLTRGRAEQPDRSARDASLTRQS